MECNIKPKATFNDFARMHLLLWASKVYIWEPKYSFRYPVKKNEALKLFNTGEYNLVLYQNKGQLSTSVSIDHISCIRRKSL